MLVTAHVKLVFIEILSSWATNGTEVVKRHITVHFLSCYRPT